MPRLRPPTSPEDWPTCVDCPDQGRPAHRLKPHPKGWGWRCERRFAADQPTTQPYKLLQVKGQQRAVTVPLPFKRW